MFLLPDYHEKSIIIAHQYYNKFEAFWCMRTFSCSVGRGLGLGLVTLALTLLALLASLRFVKPTVNFNINNIIKQRTAYGCHKTLKSYSIIHNRRFNMSFLPVLLGT